MTKKTQDIGWLLPWVLVAVVAVGFLIMVSLHRDTVDQVLAFCASGDAPASAAQMCQDAAR